MTVIRLPALGMHVVTAARTLRVTSWLNCRLAVLRLAMGSTLTEVVVSVIRLSVRLMVRLVLLSIVWPCAILTFLWPAKAPVLARVATMPGTLIEKCLMWTWCSTARRLLRLSLEFRLWLSVWTQALVE